MNTIGERVYVIPTKDDGCGGVSKRRRIEDLGASGSNNIMSNPIIEFPDLLDIDAQDLEIKSRVRHLLVIQSFWICRRILRYF